jgi:hypothetical protein
MIPSLSFDSLKFANFETFQQASKRSNPLLRKGNSSSFDSYLVDSPSPLQVV